MILLSACGGQPTEDSGDQSSTTGVTLSPVNPSLTANATQTFTASGGTPPYTFAIVSGGGSIDANGLFTAPAATGTVVVGVSDSAGSTAKTNVSVYGPVTISPATVTVGTGSTTPFTAAGGKLPYTYSKVSGVGAISASTGLYSAGASAGTATVKVTDSLGQTATAAITVNLALSISPATANVAQSGTLSFSGGGGTPPYIFSIVSGGGSINASTGAFTAPASAGTVTVKITDAVNATATATVTVVAPVAIAPATYTLAVNNTKTFTASGGAAPYVFSIVSGGGTINASTGAYTAPAASGSATIKVTDATGQTATAVITINPSLAIAPSTATVAAGGTQSFSASGGVSPYTYSVVSGGGSINSSTGAFTAPASAATVTIKVTDALANTSTATVTVLAPVTITPATKTLAVNNSFTLTAGGGQSPYTFSVFAGGGTVNASTGAYTAPATSGTATVRVTDSLGGFADATITVNPALAIAPATATLAYSGSKTFSATGGVGPYTYSVTAGAGSVNASTGVYTAGTSAGSATVQVADSLGNTSTATVTIVTPVTIAPATATVATNGTQTFTASGGQAPYVFSIVSGGGSINSTSGDFTAGASAGTVTVKVQDAAGQSATATVTVVPPLTISPATVTLAVNNSKTFTASGGQAPYIFAVLSGGGSVNASTGAYTAPATSGSAVILVTDNVGQTATANVTINPALAISPATTTVAQSGSATFSASGGVSPYTFSIASGGGSINSSTGAFTAPATSGTVSVLVTDALSNTSTATVTVVAPVTISPATVTLAILNSQTFAAAGGSSPYTFSVLSGGGAVNSTTGVYTAGAAPGSAVVRVTDSIGQTADATITINSAITIAPTAVTLGYSGTQTFTASGGVAPYSYAVTAGGGSVGSTTGAFTAGASAGTTTVQVSDAQGNSASATVTVVTPVTITPATVTIAPGTTQTFTASGGQTPYAFSVVSGGGSINASTGAFTAPATADSVVVKVTDAAGQSATASVTVAPLLTISPTTFTLTVNGTKTFVAGGGATPYTFAVQSGGGSINASTGAYTAPATAGSAVIAVTDTSGQTATANVTITPPLVISPATLSVAVNNTSTFTATGGVTPYVFSIASGGGSINASTGAFTAPAAAGTVSVLVTDAIGGTSTATVTVNPALTISPAAVSLSSAGTQTFTSTGGTGGNVFSIVSGGGSINAASGAFTAPTGPATVSVKVTDSFGNTATSTVTVLAPLSLSPATVTLAVNNTQTFTASGGQSPYTYSLQSGGGSIGSTTGAYTAPASSGSAVVLVTDALGATATANVTINPALAISPATITLATNATQSFSATGGVTPYAYSIVSGGGSIVAGTGAFTAPATTGSVTVRVTDAKGNTSNATVTVVTPLTISPATFTLAVNNTKAFTASGGQTPYTFSIQSGTGTVNASTGVYTAPAASGSAVVKVADASGQTATATITINPALTITPTSATVVYNGTKSFTGGGGVTPYTFSVASGGGSVNASTGVYTAPAAAGTATVRITDAVGNTANATVTISNAVQITPATVTLAVGNTYTFTAAGGQSPYTFAKVTGGGSINSSTGLFTAPATAGTTTVKVTDALSQTATATITINAALSLSPNSVTLNTSATQTYTAAGGVPPYTYSVVTGTGTINSSGVFTAPASPESDVIQVTDSIGNTAQANADIYAPLTISPTPGYVLSGNVLTLSAAGGDGNYTFTIVSGVGSVDANTGDYTAPATPGTASVKVTDGLGSSATSTVTTYDPLTMSPAAVTVGPGNTQQFTTTGGIAPLAFSLVSGNGTINSSTGFYTAPASASSDVVQVVDAIGNTVTSTITVTAALQISPTTFKMGPSETKTFTAANGVPPISFSIVSGGGSINASTGAYTSPATPSTVTIAATDSLNNVSTATVTVVAPARLYAGGASSCVIYSDGSVRCWGANSYGQLGTGNTTGYGSAANQMGLNLPWVNLGTGRTAKELALGLYHTCAILDNNLVKCWGRNNNGQLGIGNTTTIGTTTASMGDGLAYTGLGTSRTAKHIYAGQYNTCAILDNNALKCWGYNVYGNLGQGNTTNYGSAANQMGDNLPAISLGTSRYATSVALGWYHTCALLDNGATKCFGRSNYGQLGYGNTNSIGTVAGQMGDSLAAVNVGTGRTVKAITAGIYHTCAVRDDNKTVCWGRNNLVQLGSVPSNTKTYGDTTGQMGDSLPIVNLGTNRYAVAIVSQYTHTCAQLDDNSVKCWGVNANGQLGIGSTSNMGGSTATMGDNLPAANLGSGFTLSTVGVSTANTCALSTGYGVKCWGAATSGALGNGSTTTSYGSTSATMGSGLPYVGL